MWWFDPEWVNARCARCGSKIWPEGDPDWGLCYACFSEKVKKEREPAIPLCDICGLYSAVTDISGYAVCSKECAEEAERM